MQQKIQAVSRRAVSLSGLGALLLSIGGPAGAALPIVGGPDKNEIYTQDTVRAAMICATAPCAT